MVRIQKRLVKKRYYGKSIYQYAVYSLNIPRRFHELLQLFLDKELEVDVRHELGTLIITLTLKPLSASKRVETFLEQENCCFLLDKASLESG